MMILIYGYLHAGLLIVQLQEFWLILMKRPCSIKVVVMWKHPCGNRDLITAHTTCSTQNMMQELFDNHILSVNVWFDISTDF